MRPYAQPVWYWIAAIAGLVLSLLSDGLGDILGLLLLTTPFIPLLMAARNRPTR